MCGLCAGWLELAVSDVWTVCVCWLELTVSDVWTVCVLVGTDCK